MPLDDAPQAAQEARLGRARTRSVYICTPIARQPARQFSNSLAQTLLLMAQLEIPAFVRQVSGNSNLPRARNELVAEFLATDYTDLLFIDDDMGWAPNDVLRLLASDKAMIGGVGAKKRMLPDADPGKWCVRIPQGELEQDAMGAIRVEAVGTGFLKIERTVFLALIDAHPEWKRNGWLKMPADVKRWYYRFFRFDADHPDEPGEDFDFCWAWNELGGQVWIDPTIRLVHVGEHEFGGDLATMLHAANKPRLTPAPRGDGDDAVAGRIPYEACPLCGSLAFSRFARADCSAHPLYHRALSPVMLWCVCETCQHVFTDGTFDDAATALLLARSNPGQVFGLEAERARAASARIVQRIARVRPHRIGAWLDVGFGNGGLMMTAAEFGYDVTGVEARQESYDAALAFGFGAWRSLPEAVEATTSDGEPGLFSVISMADVLEHMRDPVEALRLAHRALEPYGLLFLSMPNAESAVWRLATEAKANPYWSELEHYHNFGRRRLTALLGSLGFGVLDFAVSERYRMGMELIVQRKEDPACAS